jgi:DNA repair photolyase
MKLGDSTGYQIIKYKRDYAENLVIAGVEPYIKCGYRCFYCITDSQGKTRPVADPASFRQLFREELGHFNDPKYLFGIGVATDAYSDIEGECGFTRIILEELAAGGHAVSVTTKSPLVTRDIDIFTRMPKDKHKVIISFTCSTSELAQRCEPQAPPPEARLAALHELHNAGVNACVLMAPWIPGLTDTARLLELFPKGIKVFFQPLELGDVFSETRDNERVYFSAALFMGREWTQNEINRAYINECNTVGKQYWKQFDMEWRWPITRETHADNSGYLKRMRPGRYDPDQWVAEHHIEPRLPVSTG